MRALAILAVLVLCSCKSDLVTTHFDTVQEARSKGAFERGWLPPILPDSVHNISETNDLDLNRGSGSFEFSPSDYTALAARLSPASPEIARRHWSAQTAKGFATFTHTDDDSLWALALHPDGRGYYRIELRR